MTEKSTEQYSEDDMVKAYNLGYAHGIVNKMPLEPSLTIRTLNLILRKGKNNDSNQ